MIKVNKVLLVLLAFIGVVFSPMYATAQTAETTETDKPVYQDTNPSADNYLSRRHALVGASCMVNRLSTTLAKVVGVNANYGNLVDTDFDNYFTAGSAVTADAGAAPSLTIRDMRHVYKAGTTAGFVISMPSELLKLKLAGLPFKMWFYKGGNKVGEKDCYQKGGGVLDLNIGELSGSNVTTEVTAVSDWDFDEIGFCAIEGLNVNVLGAMKIYYAFVGKNGKYYLTSDKTNGISKYKEDTKFSSDITLGTYPDSKNEKDLIDEYPDNSVQLLTIAGLGKTGAWVYAKTSDGSMPFKAGMTAGCEITNAEFLDLLSYVQVRTYQYYQVAGPTIFDKNHMKDVWTNVTPDNSGSFSVLGLNLSGAKSDYTVKANQDFNAIGLVKIGASTGDIAVHRFYVILPPEYDNTPAPLRVSADRSLCDEKQSLVLNSDVPVTWTCEDAHGSTLKFTNNGTKACTVSGFTTAGDYKFTATPVDNTDTRTATTKVTYGIAPVLDENIKPWVNNFTETDEQGTMIKYSVVTKDQLKAWKLADFDLIPATATKNDSTLVTPSLDDYAKYVSGLQVGNDKMIAGVYRDHPITTTKNTIVGFAVRLHWNAADVSLANGMFVDIYDSGEKKTPAGANQNFKVLSAVVASADNKNECTTQYTVEIPAGTTFDTVTLWNKGLLELGISELDLLYAFTESSDDVNKYNLAVSNNEQKVSVKDGASIDASNLGNFSVADVVGVVSNLTGIIDDTSDPTLIVMPVKAGSSQPIPVKLARSYEGGHQVAIEYSTQNELKVSLASFFQVLAYKDGKQVDQMTNWNVLGANVIGGYGHQQIVWSPKQDFDEIIIRLSGGADVANVLKFYAIRIKNDADSDGIPDDSDPQSCEGSFLIDENQMTLVKPHDFVNQCMNLRRFMDINAEGSTKATVDDVTGQWFNICLPVDLTFSQFASTFGNDARLAKPDDFVVGKARILHFSIPYRYGNQVLLHHGVPYIIFIDDISNLTTVDETLSTELANNDKNVTSSSDPRVYKVQGVTFKQGDDWATCDKHVDCFHPNTSDCKIANNAKWEGNYFALTSVPAYAYIFNKGKLTCFSKEINKLRGLRSWMHEASEDCKTIYTTTSSASKQYSGFSFKDENNGATTGIINVELQDKAKEGIYNLQGMKMDLSQKLPAGVYIVDGKKSVIK